MSEINSYNQCVTFPTETSQQVHREGYLLLPGTIERWVKCSDVRATNLSTLVLHDSQVVHFS
jgi:hypothetical protein